MSTAAGLVGQTIAGGRYQIVQLLGEGGMGAVYQARQVAMDRMVALKLIRAEYVQTPQAAARFHQEMRTTARVEHPNTIRVYDFGEAEGGQLFLTMEFLAGRSLGAVIEAEGRLPLDRIVRIARQVCNALGAAHQSGVVHRDLKPENVMLLESFGERDHVKVVDFGIAKSLDDAQPKLTATGSLVGTPAYMAPEQALGRPVDGRTDLYALGVMLYQMASGDVPFHAPTMGSLLVAHATEPPPPLLGAAPDVSPALAALVMQLLEKEPSARPQTAAAVVARLDACLVDPFGATLAAPPAPPAPPRGSRRKVWLFAAGAVVLAAAGGGVAAVLGAGGGGSGGGGGGGGTDCEALLASATEKVQADPGAALVIADRMVAECGSGHNVRGNALQKLGKLDEAEDAYVRALTADPKDDRPRFNLGLLQLRREDASAVATFTELLRRNEDHPNARLVRAKAYVLAKRYDEALGDLEEEVRRRPENGAAWAALGQMREHLKKGDAQEAYCKAKALGEKGVEAFCKQ